MCGAGAYFVVTAGTTIESSSRGPPRSGAPRTHVRPAPFRSVEWQAAAAGSVVCAAVCGAGASRQSRCSEEPEFVAVHAAHLVVVQCHATNPTVGRQSPGLRFDLLGCEYPGDGCEQGVAVEQFEVAGELFDAVDLAAPFDLDGDRSDRSRRDTADPPARWRSCTRGAPACIPYRAARRVRPAAPAGAPRRRP